MKPWFVLVVALAGCSDSKQEPPKQETGPNTIPPRAGPDEACVARTHELADWLHALVTAGPLPFASGSVKLAVLDGAAATTLPELPTVTLSPTTIEFHGDLVPDAKGLAFALAAAHLTGVAFAIDETTPWSLVAPAVTDATGVVKGPITFVFAAGAPSTVPPPPKSSIDAEIEAVEKLDPAAKATPLPKPGDPTLADKVFKNCPEIATEVLPKIGAAPDGAARDALLTGELPKAIAACGCKLEIPAVQRLVWSWFNRDSGTPQTTVTLHVGAPGTKLTAKPDAPWSETGKAVAAVAKAFEPVVFR